MRRVILLIAASVVALLASGAPPVSRDLAAQARAAGQAAPAGSPVVRVGMLRNGSYAIVTLPMEVYVARVLAGEAAPDTPPAALEALAIAIRTYTITNRGKHAADGFDLCDQTHCQVMRDAQPVTERAALATADQILLYKGAPATVYYSASCGGRTEKPSNVWPGAADPPYLPIQDDDGCGGFPMWSAELATVDLERALVAGGFRGSLRDVRILARNDSGRVARLALDGMNPREISGQDLRMVVGRTLGFQHIQGAAFDLHRTGRAFRFTGHGSGHGVGMCVIGSMKLAARGQTAAAILQHYFPGTQIGSSAPRLTAAPPDRPTIGAPPRQTVAAPPALPAPATPPAAAAPPPLARLDSSRGVDQPESGRVEPSERSDVAVALPDADRPERATLVALVASQRESVARALGVDPPPRVALRLHDSTESYERATGQPWFTLGAVTRGEIQLVPLWMLRERGMLERTIRHELVHVMADPLLQGRSMWVREGAAAYFADPGARVAARPPCPPDIELQRPTSPGALADSWARARGCFEREFAGSRDWRKVR